MHSSGTTDANTAVADSPAFPPAGGTHPEAEIPHVANHHAVSTGASATGDLAVTVADAGRAAARDNTARNFRDDGTLPTPFDQGENDIDRGITQGIRSALMNHDELSVKARNIKIVTRDGVVTLRGPVQDQQERQAIAALANAQGGVKRVDDLLEPVQP